MLSYLGDMMEDTIILSWGHAKSAHTVLICEMETGIVNWFDSERRQDPGGSRPMSYFCQ